MKESAIKIVATLQQNGYEAVFAGGCVRDELLGVKPKDYDIATNATPDQVERLFDRTIPVGKSFGVVRVLLNGNEFEVATFRSDSNESDGRRPNKVKFCSMEQDAKRRDFTINGLFFDPIKQKLYDFVGGQEDLNNKILKFIGEPEERIREDYLRMLRFVRFTYKFQLFRDAESYHAVKRNAFKIRYISKERIREELVKAFESEYACGYVGMLDELNLLNFIIPELYLLKGSIQSPIYHPEGDVWVHSIKVLENLGRENYLLKLAGLLHDIGKPFAQKITTDKISNNGHDQIGADLASLILARLKFSNDEIEHVIFLIENHMRIAKELKTAKIRKLKASPFFDDLIKLFHADVMAANQDLTSYNEFIERCNNLPQEKVLPKCLINGYDLMELGFNQGKELGNILKEVFDLQLEGALITREDQLDYIRRIYGRTT